MTPFGGGETQVDHIGRRGRIEERDEQRVRSGGHPAREVPLLRRAALAGSLGPTRRALEDLGDGDTAPGQRDGLGEPRSCLGRGQAGDASGSGPAPRPALGTVAPVSVTAVMVPDTVRRTGVGEHDRARGQRTGGGRLARAVPGGRLGVGRTDRWPPGPRGGPPGELVPGEPRSDGHPGQDDPTTRRARATGAARSCGPGSLSGPLSALRRRPARRGHPRRAAASTTHARQLEQDGQGEHRGTAGAPGWPSRPTSCGYCAAQPNAGWRGNGSALLGQGEAPGRGVARVDRARPRPRRCGRHGRPARRARAANPTTSSGPGQRNAVPPAPRAGALGREGDGLGVLEDLRPRTLRARSAGRSGRAGPVGARPGAGPRPTGPVRSRTGPGRPPPRRTAPPVAPAAGRGGSSRRRWPAGRPGPPVPPARGRPASRRRSASGSPWSVSGVGQPGLDRPPADREGAGVAQPQGAVRPGAARLVEKAQGLLDAAGGQAPAPVERARPRRGGGPA